MSTPNIAGPGQPSIPSSIQMVRADLRLRSFHRWMGSRGFQDPDHAAHSLLTECFGELAPKPFRLITPQRGRTGVLYGYGRADATTMREQAGIFADPLQIRALPPDGIDSKPMPTRWRQGLRVGFETRIRPIVRRSRRGSNPKAGEQDAFLAEAVQHPPGGMKRSREDVYVEWLTNRLEPGGGVRVDPDRTKLVSFRRKRATYQLHGRTSEGPDAILRGTLTIVDSDAFTGLLARGVGRHRAYGYGMLLLRPAHK